MAVVCCGILVIEFWKLGIEGTVPGPSSIPGLQPQLLILKAEGKGAPREHGSACGPAVGHVTG